MASTDVAAAVKACSKCKHEFPKSSFTSRQWQQSKQRKCKSCVAVEAQAAPAVAAANESHQSSHVTRKKKGKRNKPVFAGSGKGCYKPPKGDSIAFAVGASFCAWCGKAEETEEQNTCERCENILYCSRTCQKAHYPEHKLVCGQLKQDRKNSKAQRKAEKQGALSLSEASGTGSHFLDLQPPPKGILSMCITAGELRGEEKPGQHFASDASRLAIMDRLGSNFQLFCQKMEEESAKLQGTLKRTEMFHHVDELGSIEQFLLSCGPLNDIERAKNALPHVLYMISISGLKPDGNTPDIGDIKVRGFGLNSLEWAARRGNYTIAKWLATDSRTKVMLTRSDSAPVAWACYTNKVELAKLLVEHGADSHSTTKVLFGFKPPSHLASENGQLLALKYLIEECGHDINERDTLGEDMRASLRRNNKVWAEVSGCVACDDYAKSKGVEGEILRRNRRNIEAAHARAADG